MISTTAIQSVYQIATRAFAETAAFLTPPNRLISFEKIVKRVLKRLGLPTSFEESKWGQIDYDLWYITEYEEIIDCFTAELQYV